MVKADMRKGMLLKGKIGAEERIYRVLDLKEKVLVLDCVKKTMPVWKTYEELSDYVEKEEESMAEAIDIRRSEKDNGVPPLFVLIKISKTLSGSCSSCK